MCYEKHLYLSTSITDLEGVDESFGPEGCASRKAAEQRADAFFTGQLNEDARRNANITQEENDGISHT
jgi:hypothetical protein